MLRATSSLTNSHEGAEHYLIGISLKFVSREFHPLPVAAKSLRLPPDTRVHVTVNTSRMAPADLSLYRRPHFQKHAACRVLAGLGKVEEQNLANSLTEIRNCCLTMVALLFLFSFIVWDNSVLLFVDSPSLLL